MPQKMLLDELYVELRSNRMYLRILWWTVVAIGLRREVAVSRTTARMNLRRRPAQAAGEAQMEGVA